MDRCHPTRGFRRSVPVLLVAALTLSGCAAGGQGTASQPLESAVNDSRGSEDPPASQTPGPSPQAGTASISGAVPVQSAELGSTEKAPAPVRVVYPGIDAEIPVLAHGVSDDGQMDIPDDAAEAAWYQYGRAPADDTGTTVIAAHAGSTHTPVGPLYLLHEAQPGEEITVEDESGEEFLYEVTEVEQQDKDDLDFTPYFARDGEHFLVLITCGGQWNPDRSSYNDNIIVTATPAD
ncbi:class F sortase [Nesterenkonia salmonea]|uniref:Class F sortase n=1 Tax=Nesterenkonia salmonea TaxID=1804987 RepID=A0A5R9BBB9_9MICC|nr:class F sortase [Nesterenkonia salmonea]TLP96076.1 class F sortase [Nesterenkonia salmonea]